MKKVKFKKFKSTLWIIQLLEVSLIICIILFEGQSKAEEIKEGNRLFFFDQEKSTLSFSATSTLHPVKGKVTRFLGKIMFFPMNNRSPGNVILNIEASSLDTNHESRDKKVKDNCLEINRFPLIQFKSIEILNKEGNFSPGQRGCAEVIGILHLHGIQKEISFPVDYTYNKTSLHVSGRVTIKRSDFQIPEPKFLFLRVKDEIEIEFDIHAFPYSNPS